MAEMGTDPDPDSELESKIWRLTGFGVGSGFFVFEAGSGFRVNFSDSAHLCWSAAF